MFKELLIENNAVLLNQTASDWKAAIKLGTDLLEKAGAVDARYYGNIISKIEEIGPYIILAPGLAMPHARPEDGVLKTAFALVTFREPVYFDGSDEGVSVMITLAGSDANSHIAGLMDMTQMLEEPDSDTGVNLDKLLNCQSVEELYAVL